MQKIVFRVTLLMLVLLALPIASVIAQEEVPLTTVIDLADGYAISVPDDWESEVDEQVGGTILTDGELTMYVLNPVQLTEVVELEADTALDDLLIDLYNELYDERPRRRDIEVTEFDGREAVMWAYSDGGFEGVFYVLRLSDGTIGAVDVYSEDVDMEDVAELVTSMITTFGVSADGPAASGGSPAEPCFVSTDEETVELRVGPGTNRSVISNLPSGEAFVVTGRFTTDDGDVWYQLDKEEVLPNSAANEIWVAAEDVETTGDCDAVVDASAPPIIPITNPQPTRVPDTAGGTTGGTTGGGATSNPIPVTGLWTISLDARTTASCAGTNTITVNTADVYFSTSFTIFISSVAADGSSFIADGDVFTRQNNGYYNGSYTYSDGTNDQLYMFPTSARSMVGSIVWNFTSGGRNCSATTNITATR